MIPQTRPALLNVRAVPHTHLFAVVLWPEPEPAGPLSLYEVACSNLTRQLSTKQLVQQRLGDVWLCQ